MKLKNKKGEVNIIAVVLAIVFVVAISSLIFTWVRKTATEGTEKSADKVTAQDICNDKVKISVNDVKDNGDNFDISLENLKSLPITDFIVRMEKDSEADVKKVKQIVGSYESIVLNVKKPSGFNPQVIKVVPRITLGKPDITSLQEGWWICSKQLSEYEVY
ncbi:MAG: hypothetical protein CMH62_02340 [Nanoarchaeota archaeon]|nr:hypothetical protein [Nanoarchaeota archaeon]|tara:strand:- start:1228 stop:1710 length:483 start_codon:yes stop_codon:yes gene_type:complete